MQSSLQQQICSDIMSMQKNLAKVLQFFQENSVESCE
jgi:ABC-type lipopolysaccharide export system ATPase subunit